MDHEKLKKLDNFIKNYRKSNLSRAPKISSSMEEIKQEIHKFEERRKSIHLLKDVNLPMISGRNSAEEILNGEDSKHSFTFRRRQSKKSLNLLPKDMIIYNMKKKTSSNFGGYIFPKSKNRVEKPVKMANLFLTNRKQSVYKINKVNFNMPDKEATYLDKFGKEMSNQISLESVELNKIQEHLNLLNLKVLSKCKNPVKNSKRY